MPRGPGLGHSRGMTEIAEQAAPTAFAFRERGTGGAAPSAERVPARETVADDHLKVAYFTNVYPKISHSFIKTEIEALERRGFVVSRFTVRRSGERFEDVSDRLEAACTHALLEHRVALVLAAISACVVRPGAAMGALALAWRTAGSGGRWKALAYFAEAALLAQRLTRRGISHVHAHFGTNPAAVARLAARLAPITYSFTVHGPDEFDDPRGLDLRGKIAEAAFVAGVSSFGRGQLMRWASPGDWQRLHVVRCAPSPSFVPASETGASPLEFPPAPHLLCVARLSAQKGLPLLIEAMERIAAHRAVTLDVIGDGEDRAAIERQIARAGLERRVRLLGWATPEAIRAALQQARALVLPSFAEGLPVVLMEAMASGRPVITTAIAGIPELVDERVGWLVPSGSSDAMAAAIEAALDASPRELAAMGERGRRRVLERHDPDRSAHQLADQLAPLVQAKAGFSRGSAQIRQD